MAREMRVRPGVSAGFRVWVSGLRRCEGFGFRPRFHPELNHKTSKTLAPRRERKSPDLPNNYCTKRVLLPVGLRGHQTRLMRDDVVMVTCV